MKLKTLLVLFFCSTSIVAQEKPLKQIWKSYSQAVDVTNEMKGATFKVSVYIRKEYARTNTQAGLWIRVDEDGFFKNSLNNEEVITEEWKKFEIEGVIDSTATKLNFGSIMVYNGIYYFDEFEASFKNQQQQWVPIQIDNQGFESVANEDKWQGGIRSDREVIVANYTTNYDSTNPYKGHFSLRMEGKGIIGNARNGKFVKINNVDLYYETYGEGEPLLLIHGNGQSIGAFIHQVDELAKHYKVIVVDSRGRGNSTYDESVELTYALQVEDMKLFLDILEIEKAHIIGWSDGAIIGLMMAIKYPEKVDKLLAFAANIKPEGVLDDELVSIKETLASMNAAGQKDIYRDLYNLLVNYPNLDFKELKAIKSKTLIMAGDHDLIKHSHTVSIFENIPNAQLAILPNETHYFLEENPILFNKMALEFFKNEE